MPPGTVIAAKPGRQHSAAFGVGHRDPVSDRGRAEFLTCEKIGAVPRRIAQISGLPLKRDQTVQRLLPPEAEAPRQTAFWESRSIIRICKNPF